VDDLGYRGPELLFRAVLSVRAAARKPAFFKRAIDLGCGTGLRGTAFAKEVDHFIGIDLSPRMIERARATGFYAELEVADMVQGCARSRMPAPISSWPRMRWSMSPISPRCCRSRRVLAAGGLFAFTTETHAARASSSARAALRPRGAYVRAAVEAAGLKLSLQGKIVPRATRDNIPVRGPGRIVSKLESRRCDFRCHGNAARCPGGNAQRSVSSLLRQLSGMLIIAAIKGERQ
jgi:predicted TPR repeat methyltransferase